MTTTIYIYDPEIPEAPLPPLPIGLLLIGAGQLIQEAAKLPQPRYVTISETQKIGLQFPPHRSSFRAITQWALRFGGVVASEPHRNSDGARTTHCHAEFSYYGVDVDIYAFIPA